jgi:TrmH family RNA methyltransferase
MNATESTRALEVARADPQLVVLEGFHAVKHALRFGAALTHVFAVEPAAARSLAVDLAPDLVDAFTERAVAAPQIALLGVHTGVVGIARRPAVDLAGVLATPTNAPVVLLEHPRRLGNVGAAVRVAAAAGAAGLMTTGTADPWDPTALRGSAGLHYALPVGRVDGLETRRPVIGLTPDGDRLVPSELPAGAVLAFGSERSGLSAELLARCDARLALPMRPGVSSLNLATAVAAVLFAWRLRGTN